MPAAYQPISVYDTPGVLLHQLLDNQTTFAGIKNTLLSPDRLSPTERESITDTIKRASGSNTRLTDTLIDVATNPFVWLMFLTSAPGVAAISEGTALFGAASKFSAFVQRNAGVLSPLLNAQQKLRGTHVGEAINDLSNEIERLKVPRVGNLSGAWTPVLQEAGLDHAWAGAYAEADPRRAVAQEINTALTARLHGLEVPRDVNTATVTLRKFKAGIGEVLGSAEEIGDEEFERLSKRLADHEAGVSELQRSVEAAQGTDVVDSLREKLAKAQGNAPTMTFVKPEVNVGAAYTVDLGLDPEKVQAVFDKYPSLRGVVDAYKQERAGALGRVMYDEGGEPDAGKLYKLLRNTQGKPEDLRFVVDSVSGQGADGLSLLLSPAVKRAREYGILSQDEFENVVKQAFTGAIQEDYLPLNQIEEVKLPEIGDKRLLKRSTLQAMQDGKISGPTSSVIGKRSAPPLFHPDSLDQFLDFAGDGGARIGELKAQTRGVALRKAADGEAMGAYAMDAVPQYDRYFNKMETTKALYVDAPGEAVVNAQKQTLPFVDTDAKFPWETIEGVALAIGKDFSASGGGWERHFSRYDAITQGLALTRDENTKRMVTEAVLPQVLGTMRPEYGPMASAFYSAKSALGDFVESGFGQGIEQTGPMGAKVIGKLRALADPENSLPQGGGLSGSIARWFYASHLGLNLSSVTMNAMQPFLLVAPTLGLQNTMRGYGAALGDLGRYAEQRVAKFGIGPITAAQRLSVMKTAIPFWEEAGLGGDFLQQLDQMVYNGRRQARTGLDVAEEYLLKGFEKSEHLNRLTTAHALRVTYEDAGRPLDAGFKEELQRFVQQTQFVPGPLTTPDVLLRRTGGGVLNQIVSNPAIKQFTTFPIRSFTAAFDTFPRLGENPDYWKGLATFLARGMGTSAVVYEVGKGILGADLSRGLFAGSLTDIFGGDRFLEKGNDWIPVPPVVAVPKDLIAGFATDDMTLLKGALARSFPAGLAIQRALGVAPDLGDAPLPVSLLGGLQKQFVDWSRPTPEGAVPVLNWQGRVTDYQMPSDIILKGLGLSLPGPGALDGYLVKQGDEIKQYRGEYLKRLVRGDMVGAQGVQAEFGKRFKTPDGQPIPLTVTREQVKAYQQGLEVPRGERILDRFPAGLRPQYGQMIAERGGGNVPAESLQGGTSRTRAGQRTGRSAEITPEVLASLEARRRSVGAGESAGGTPGPFESFNQQ